MNSTAYSSPNRRAAVNGLAVVGFIALVFAGMGLAIYAARFVPTAVNQLASASVFFSSVFAPSNEGTGLEVVPNSETVIPFDQTPEGEIAGTVGTTTDTPVEEEPATDIVASTPAPGPKTTTQIPVTVSVPQTPYGKADLTVTITAVGYLDKGTNTDSFKSASNVPVGKRGAVKFVVTNIGTNVTGSWKFKAVLPTSPNYTFTSPGQSSLKPNDRVEYVLGFDRTRKGDNREIEITVDSAKDVEEI
ncbi:MAG: hypothetical protein RIQ56_1003, partial [Candidatus Parcubacteria bacterium]